MNKKCYWVYEKLFDYCLVFGRYKWFGCDRGAECCIDSSGMLRGIDKGFKVVSEIPSGVWSEKILDKVRDPFFEIDFIREVEPDVYVVDIEDLQKNIREIERRLSE